MFRSTTCRAGANGHDGEGHQHGHHDHGRRDDEHRLVRERRNPVLLRQQLDRVGERLEDAEGADTVGAVAVLPQREQPPLEPYQQAATVSSAEEHDEDHGQRSAAVRSSLGLELADAALPDSASHGSDGSHRQAGDRRGQGRQCAHDEAMRRVTDLTSTASLL